LKELTCLSLSRAKGLIPFIWLFAVVIALARLPGDHNNLPVCSNFDALNPNAGSAHSLDGTRNV
jgi:hypothetical protein